jgi:hypothetical protein
VIKLVCVLVKFEHVIATDWPMVCNLWPFAVGDSAGSTENCLEMMREPTNRDLPGLFRCLKYAGANRGSVPSGKGADRKSDSSGLRSMPILKN